MFDVHVMAGTATSAVWFAERDGRFESMPEAIRRADDLLADAPAHPGDPGVRDAVIVDMQDNAYDESGAPCKLPVSLRGGDQP